MITMTTRDAIGLMALLTLAGCRGPSEPSFDQQLVGTWNLVRVEGFAVPGWVRHCQPVCDSAFVARGRLVFDSGAACIRTTIYSAEQPASEQHCTYSVGEAFASLWFEGDPTRYTVKIHVDVLSLLGPPCPVTAWDLYDCSRYEEDYERANS